MAARALLVVAAFAAVYILILLATGIYVGWIPLEVTS